MQKKVKVLVFAVCAVFLISILFGWIPIPLVPVFHPKSIWPIGLLSCHQLEQRTWYRCHTSGEFNGCEPFLGVKSPLIYELIFSKNCPDFHPPTYCGTC